MISSNKYPDIFLESISWEKVFTTIFSITKLIIIVNKIKEYIKYDSPKELSEYNIKYAPQSYVYIK